MATLVLQFTRVQMKANRRLAMPPSKHTLVSQSLCGWCEFTMCPQTSSTPGMGDVSRHRVSLPHLTCQPLPSGLLTGMQAHRLLHISMNKPACHRIRKSDPGLATFHWLGLVPRGPCDNQALLLTFIGAVLYRRCAPHPRNRPPL